MKTIFEAIRLDREFNEAERTLEGVLLADRPLPLIINGLSGGALPAFVSKMQIALKEANETGYWLELLYKTNYIGEEQYNFLESKCKSLRAMLVSSINTAKNNNK